MATFKNENIKVKVLVLLLLLIFKMPAVNAESEVFRELLTFKYEYICTEQLGNFRLYMGNNTVYRNSENYNNFFASFKKEYTPKGVTNFLATRIIYGGEVTPEMKNLSFDISEVHFKKVGNIKYIGIFICTCFSTEGNGTQMLHDLSWHCRVYENIEWQAIEPNTIAELMYDTAYNRLLLLEEVFPWRK